MKISVIVHVLNKQPRIERDLFGVLHVYVCEPPLENRAHEAVVRALAHHFRVATSQIHLALGAKSKHKVFEIVK